MISAINKEKFDQLYFYVLILIAATLCFPTINAINGIGIIILGVIWIAEGQWAEKWKNIKGSKLTLLLIGFFAIHLVGLMKTDNLSQGVGVIIDYMPFCLFPLVLTSITPLSERKVTIIISVFVLSCFLAVSICLSNSLQIAFSEEAKTYKEHEYWFYSLFTKPLHINPIYLSLYVGFCVFFIGAYWLQAGAQLLLIEKVILGFFILLFMSVLCLLATRTTLISTVILALGNYVFYVYKEKKKFWYLVPAIVAPLLLILVIYSSSFLSKRFNDIKNFSNKGIAENQYKRQTIQKPWKGASVRLAIWKTSMTIVEKNFFMGVGTGDTQEELIKAYKANNYFFEKDGETRHNAHNQFIQTQVTTGFIGLTLLVSILLMCFYKGWQQRNYFYMTFIIYIILNCQTEALLQRPKGIVFFSMISFVIFFSLDKRKAIKPEKELMLKYV